MRLLLDPVGVWFSDERYAIPGCAARPWALEFNAFGVSKRDALLRVISLFRIRYDGVRASPLTVTLRSASILTSSPSESSP